ncbi:hypothetical protein DPMN_029294 [Dreissena polymorpha]|uniref:Uncharacterized protein n=1 Tax=Dreissena polymorpha TaxID=45954 RepID=A0A9D4RH89_DREPO|nr:hypothetical protein DPMN_029294 [Dreissena polymorpha]
MTLKNSVIKGDHAFEIRPPMILPHCPLNVEPEYTNIKDVCACLVWIPELDFFAPDIHGIITDDKRHLKLTDVAGLPIGRVPRSLAPYFRKVIDNGGKVLSEVTGAPVPSYPPWPAQHEEGGVVLPCDYIISTPCKDDFDVISGALNSFPEGSAMELVMPHDI